MQAIKKAFGFGKTVQIQNTAVKKFGVVYGLSDGNVRRIELGGRKVNSASHGVAHSLAVSDGKVYGWGDDYFGQIGSSLSTSWIDDAEHLEPVHVECLENVSKVVSGYFHNLALSGSEVYSWGAGILGDGKEIYLPNPDKLDIGPVDDISAAGSYSAIMKQGSVFVWGYLPQNGLKSLVPMEVELPEKVRSIKSSPARFVVEGDENFWILGSAQQENKPYAPLFNAEMSLIDSSKSVDMDKIRIAKPNTEIEFSCSDVEKTLLCTYDANLLLIPHANPQCIRVELKLPSAIKVFDAQFIGSDLILVSSDGIWQANLKTLECKRILEQKELLGIAACYASAVVY